MVADELDRLGATEVLLLGGTTALSEDVAAGLGDRTVTRVAGRDRVQTALRNRSTPRPLLHRVRRRHRRGRGRAGGRCGGCAARGAGPARRTAAGPAGPGPGRARRHRGAGRRRAGGRGPVRRRRARRPGTPGGPARGRRPLCHGRGRDRGRGRGRAPTPPGPGWPRGAPCRTAWPRPRRSRPRAACWCCSTAATRGRPAPPPTCCGPGRRTRWWSWGVPTPWRRRSRGSCPWSCTGRRCRAAVARCSRSTVSSPCTATTAHPPSASWANSRRTRQRRGWRPWRPPTAPTAGTCCPPSSSSCRWRPPARGPTATTPTPVTRDEIQPWLDAARAAGAYLLLDLQPGRTDFLTDARRYEELLREPDVGLALDPEWRLGPDQRHLEQVGSVDASEVNAVSAWLAGIVREEGLPQKLFVLHQFQLRMVTQPRPARAPPRARHAGADGRPGQSRGEAVDVGRVDAGRRVPGTTGSSCSTTRTRTCSPPPTCSACAPWWSTSATSETCSRSRRHVVPSPPRSLGQRSPCVAACHRERSPACRVSVPSAPTRRARGGPAGQPARRRDPSDRR